MACHGLRIQSHKLKEICNEARRQNKLIIRNFHDVLLLIRRQPVCVQSDATTVSRFGDGQHREIKWVV